MRIKGRKYRVNRAEGKLLGVCAGIADNIGIDATIVRIALVVATIAGGFPWTVIAYALLFWIGRESAPAGGRAHRRHRQSPEEARERMRALDLRMQAVETYVTSSNSSLAREIEELR